MDEPRPPASPTPPALVRRLALAFLVALVAMLPYLTQLEGKDFAFDDNRFILKNTHVSSVTDVGEALERFPQYMVDPNTVDPLSPRGIVRPLRTFEFALDRALFGFSPKAFAVHNALWHAATSLALFLLLTAVFRGWSAPLVGALVYAAHPIHVEAVAFISSRGDTATGACVFGSLAAFARAHGRDRWWGLALFLGLLAMLYKETAITLPFLVVAVSWMRDSRRGHGEHLWRRGLLEAVPFVLLSGVYLVYRQSVAVGDTGHVSTFVMGGSTPGTFATMFRAFGYYLSTTVLPGTPSVDWYMHVSTRLLEFAALGWMLVHVTLLGGALFLTRRMPHAAAAVVLFYAPLLPVTNWPFALGIPTADRFLYISISGLAVVAALAWKHLPAPSRRVAVPAVALAVASMMVSTRERAGIWIDETTLWARTLALYDSPRGFGYEASELRREGFNLLQRAGDARSPEEKERLRTEARDVLKRALERAHQAIDRWHLAERVTRSDSFPVLPPHNNAGNILFLLEEPDHGLFHAREALRIGINELGWEKQHELPPAPAYNLAYLNRDVDRPIAALLAMEMSIGQGMTLSRTEATKFFGTVGQRLFELGAYELVLRAAGWEDRFTGLEPGRTPRVEAAMRDRNAALQRAVDAGEPSAGAWLALFRAGLGERAGALPDRAPPGVDAVAWIRARWEFRGSRQGWEQAERAYRELGNAPSRAFYRRAVCLENLGRLEEALEVAQEALDGGPVTAEWRADAERMRDRLRTGCPVQRDHGLRDD